MLKNLLAAAIITSANLLSIIPAKAEATMPPVVEKAQNFLDTLSTAKARFVQTAWDGSQIVGTFYLNRPGRLRFEYDAPIKDFIVADGTFIYFYDSQIQEQSSAPIGQTLANFLLQENIELNNKGEVKVKEVAEKGGLTTIKLERDGDEGAGSLTLGFSNEPFELKKWRVVDAQNMITEVELFKLEINPELDKKLFIYRNPHKKRTLND